MTSKDTVDAHVRGTFYRRPDPSEPPFVEEGDSVTEEDVIGLIEVMKNFMEIKSTKEGEIKQFLVDNEELVEEEQPLVEIE
jgi:acetyl-CoA carboxylase biotin carboxyl carrier protein